MVQVVESRPPTDQHPFRLAQTGLLAHVLEQELSSIVVERAVVVGEVGHEQVQTPVVVVIGRIHAHACLETAVGVGGQAAQETRFP